MFFADVDLSALTSFLNSLIPALGAFDPTVAGLGALILYVVQKLGAKKFSLWETVKWVLGKFAPRKDEPVQSVVDPILDPADTSDLAEDEKGVLRAFLEKLRGMRKSEPVEQKIEALKKELLK